MQRFFGHQFLHMVAQWEQLRERAHQQGDKVLDAEVLELLERLMPDLHEFLNTSGFIFTAKMTSRPWSQSNTRGQLSQWADELNARLRDEMESKVYLTIEPRMVHYYDEPHLFGADVAAKFPSAAFDIEEAGKCLALRRGTACVFHLMRALETGLYALARALNVEDIQENWQNAIDQIEKAIQEIVRKPVSRKVDAKQREDWKQNDQFYSEVATHFLYIKEAWRNHSAHVGHVYPDEKALQIFESTRSFMQHLATRLNEVSS